MTVVRRNGRSATVMDFDLGIERAGGLLVSAWEKSTAEERDKARSRVAELVGRWGRRNRRTLVRKRYNERLVMAQLGIATAEEEADVWDRYRRASRTGLYPRWR